MRNGLVTQNTACTMILYSISKPGILLRIISVLLRSLVLTLKTILPMILSLMKPLIFIQIAIMKEKNRQMPLVPIICLEKAGEVHLKMGAQAIHGILAH